MENILVSACLFGVNCRYDGMSKPNEKVLKLKERYNCILVCPEVSGGLPIPRLPSEIVGDKVIMCDGTDVTAQYSKGAHLALKTAKENDCKIAVLKSRSPSCGKGQIYDGTYTKTLINGNGVTADLLIANGITVLDETELNKLGL